MKIIAQAAHDRDPVRLIATEKQILDFTDRKIAFLDRVYTLKRTYIFSHGKPSKNLTPTTFDEIMAEYEYFKTSSDEFETEEDRAFYLATIDRRHHRSLARSDRANWAGVDGSRRGSSQD
jgi:hypothetical protein